MVKKMYTYLLFLLLVIQISEHLVSIGIHLFYHDEDIPATGRSHLQLLDHHISHQFNAQNSEFQLNIRDWPHFFNIGLYFTPLKKVVIGIWRPPKFQNHSIFADY